MIDPSKVKVGDTVVAHLKVDKVYPDRTVEVSFDGTVYACMGTWGIDRFAEHIPAPRKIEVGSRVTISWNTGEVYDVLGLHGHKVWVYGNDGYRTVYAVDLKVVD